MGFSDILRDIATESITKICKAKKSIVTNSKPKKKTTVRDERIRRAMLGMTCTPPYSVQRFLDEVAEPDDGEEVFEIFGKSHSNQH